MDFNKDFYRLAYMQDFRISKNKLNHKSKQNHFR